ncbi:MAG: hypothetical protein ACRDZO_27585, partial [Egibacteraceae bacterium]
MRLGQAAMPCRAWSALAEVGEAGGRVAVLGHVLVEGGQPESTSWQRPRSLRRPLNRNFPPHTEES